MTHVIFFQVSDNSTKLKKIVETAHLHFGKKEPLLITVEDEKSELFVDDLLWKFPNTAFLPHVVSNDSTTSDWIAITRTKKWMNQARTAFNLCPTALFLEGAKLIYEFEDLSAPVKKNLSSQRFDAYKKAGFFIEACFQ